MGRISTLPDFIAVPQRTFCATAKSALWVISMPFDLPVVPVVKRMSEVLSASGRG